MIRFPLTTVDEVRAHRGPVRWIDARAGEAGRKAYDAAHVVGAMHVDLERDLSGDFSHPEQGGRHPLPSLEVWRERLGKLGIGPETTVVVYDAKLGANAASRFWWMLRAVGHERVAVLDGSWPAIVAAGLPLEATVPTVIPMPPYPVSRWQRPTLDSDAVSAVASDPSHVLLDVREGFRFRGESEPVDPVAGHIPGAINLYYGENVDEQGAFRPAAELRARYDAILGGVAPTNLIVHCGSGVTACHTLLALERAGLHGARLYVGSWSEWCRSSRPIAKG